MSLKDIQEKYNKRIKLKKENVVKKAKIFLKEQKINVLRRKNGV